MKILVTGSSGHLGEAIVRTLQKQQIDYIGIDIVPSPFTTHIGNITDPAFVEGCMKHVSHIIHTATLHKPHVATHSKQEFIDTNITGTLNLLEAAIQHGVSSFVFTSTTSTFGDRMRPQNGAPAVWITEETVPIPKNIYGVTKTAAEDLCQLFHRNHKLPCLVLKTSRFFWEADDNKELRQSYSDLNIKANEYSHRRVDVEDIVSAHLLAIKHASNIGFRKYIISATPPFSRTNLEVLNRDAPGIIQELFPNFQEIYKSLNWKMFPQIGRVYDNEKARQELDWDPKYDFQYVLDCLANGKVFKSPLAQSIGIKGYHDEEFEDGPYPVQ